MKRVLLSISVVFIALSIHSCKTTQQVAATEQVATTEQVAKAEENTTVSPVNKNLEGKYWKLIELYGNPVTYVREDAKEAHIIFREHDKQFSGYASCNTIVGSYELKAPERIVISPVASTMAMCLDMDMETKFLQVLKTADSYVVHNDTLSMHRARMAPLARFVAVYLK